MTISLNAVITLQLTRRCLLVSGILFSFFAIHAQNVTPAVAEAFNYSYGRNGVYVDMSIGELAIATIGSPQNIITQGFLQPIDIEQPCDIPVLVSYPNPVVDKVTIEATECDVYVAYVETYDLFGKSVLVANARENTIDLTSIGVGVYLLRVYANNAQLLGTIKIIKITV
jgi:type IX secretion system substrate protein